VPFDNLNGSYACVALACGCEVLEREERASSFETARSRRSVVPILGPPKQAGEKLESKLR
jgi:hypothetical protein